MCLYYGISHKQQGPFSMPGATRCHVNMAGHRSSSCIFCCSNEWGEFCQASTASGRYCTCVLCFFVYWTQAGPRNPILGVFLNLKELLYELGWNEHVIGHPARENRMGCKGRSPGRLGVACGFLHARVHARVQPLLLPSGLLAVSMWSWLKTSGQAGVSWRHYSCIVCGGTVEPVQGYSLCWVMGLLLAGPLGLSWEKHLFYTLFAREVLNQRLLSSVSHEGPHFPGASPIW